MVQPSMVSARRGVLRIYPGRDATTRQPGHATITHPIPWRLTMTDIAELQRLLQPLFPGLMGVTLLEVTPDRVLAQMVVRPDLCTAGGILHGGASMAFADAVGAVGTIVNLPAGKMTATTDS